MAVDPAVDLDVAGVHEWAIDGVGLYVGKARVLRTRLPTSARNVRVMIAGVPWHGNPAKSYRVSLSALLLIGPRGRTLVCGARVSGVTVISVPR